MRFQNSPIQHLHTPLENDGMSPVFSNSVGSQPRLKQFVSTFQSTNFNSNPKPRRAANHALGELMRFGKIR